MSVPPTQPLPTNSTVPTGTTAEEKAWCLKAKPVMSKLINIYSLTLSELEVLIAQAYELKPTAPAPLQDPLTVLGEIGSRFLADVKAGKATLSPDGIAVWANANLSEARQLEFLQAGGTVSAYLNGTC